MAVPARRTISSWCSLASCSRPEPSKRRASVAGNCPRHNVATLHTARQRAQPFYDSTGICGRTHEAVQDRCHPGRRHRQEVIAAGIEALHKLAERDGGFAFRFDQFDWGSDYYKQHGVMRPPTGADRSPRTTRFLRRRRRAGRAGPYHAVGAATGDLSALRPIRQCPPDPHPAGDHQSLARRHRAGARLGDRARELGGRIRGRRRPGAPGMPIETATDASIMTRAGVARIMRFAFKLAQSRPRKLLTVVTKSNAQRYAMVMWDEVAAEVAREFPDVAWDKMLVDAMTMRMVNKPGTIDTVVATNLHADILSDLAAALAGLAGDRADGERQSGAGPIRRCSSRIHGSAFDITGKGIANPIGTFWTATMMLDHLGEGAASAPTDAGGSSAPRRTRRTTRRTWAVRGDDALGHRRRASPRSRPITTETRLPARPLPCGAGEGDIAIDAVHELAVWHRHEEAEHRAQMDRQQRAHRRRRAEQQQQCQSGCRPARAASG